MNSNSSLNFLLPKSISAPFAAYSHGVEVAAGSRLVFCSGQLGIGPDGQVPAGTEAQAELCFANISAILAEGGMALSDIIRINAYVTGREHMKPYMGLRAPSFVPTVKGPARTSCSGDGHARARPQYGRRRRPDSVRTSSSATSCGSVGTRSACWQSKATPIRRGDRPRARKAAIARS
jgi:enamine deaminase RidA (YjgF/YER057c/UK114 family)